MSRELRRAERDRRRAISIAVIAGAIGTVLALTVAAVAFGGPAAQPVSARVVQSVPKVPETTSVADVPSVADTAPAESPTSASAPEATAKADRAPVQKQDPSGVMQRFSIKIGTRGYEPSVVSASAKSPITLTVGKGEGCAAGFLIGSLGIDKDNSSGPVTIKLGRLRPGTYRYTCGMGMVEGKLVVR